MQYPDTGKIVEDYLSRLNAIGLYPRYREFRGTSFKVLFEPRLYSFTQTWSNTATGFDRQGTFSGQSFTDEITTVVCEDLNTNIAVYFGNKFGYFIDKATDEFSEDVKNWRIKSVGEAKCYLIR